MQVMLDFIYIISALLWTYFSAGDMVFKTGNVSAFMELVFCLQYGYRGIWYLLINNYINVMG